jgi:Bacterial regulatory proteins, lacI family
MAATMKDIAKDLGVSVVTASTVQNHSTKPFPANRLKSLYPECVALLGHAHGSNLGSQC